MCTSGCRGFALMFTFIRVMPACGIKAKWYLKVYNKKIAVSARHQ
jgi:hypothetical protein